MSNKKLMLFTAMITACNTAWLYIFSRTELRVSDTFNVTRLISLMNQSTLITMLLAGIMMSAAVFLLLFFSRTAEKKHRAVSAVLSTALAFPLVMSYYPEKTELIIMLAFYAAGMLMVAYSTRRKNTGIITKMKTGWSAAKKVTTALAIGGLLLGITITSLNMQEYQQITKQSIIEMTMNAFENMDMSTITEDIITKESIEQALISAYGENFTSLPEEQKQSLIDDSYSMAIEKSSEEKAMISAEVIEKTIDSVPFIRIFFNYLHLLTGLTIMTVILAFGEIILTPLTALFSSMLPTDEEIKPREFKAVKNFAGLPFKYQEQKRQEEETNEIEEARKNE